MNEVSKPIDLENDPFANLFKEEKQPEPVGRNSALVKKLARARRQREVARMQQLQPVQPIQEKAAALPENARQSDGISLYLLFPVAGLALCGVFLAGYYGGNFAGGKLVQEQVQVSRMIAAPVVVEKREPAAKTTEPPASVEVDPRQQIAQLTTEIARNSLSVAPVRQVPKALAAPGPVMQAHRVRVATLTKPVLGDAEQFLDYGHQLERAGDLSAARGKFLQAYEAGASAGALAIARTYDRRFQTGSPDILKAQDARLAREWYEKWYLAALQKGEISAKVRYDRLLKGLQES
jgi:hypothetical protein